VLGFLHQSLISTHAARHSTAATLL
jgi:hypothetical protein